MNYNYWIAAIVIIDNHTILASTYLMIIMYLIENFIIYICILNRYLYTEYDNIDFTLKNLAINKVNIVKKDNRPFDRLERALLN